MFINIGKLDIGGEHITKLLRALIKKRYDVSLPREIVEKIKRDLCMFFFLPWFAMSPNFVEGFIAAEESEDAQEEAEDNPVPWIYNGVTVFEKIGM